MSVSVNVKNWRQQASHFDQTGPFVPGPRILREVGFKCQYILKDVVIAEALDALSIEPGCRVLDVGCGRGVLLDRLGASYRTAGFGVDVSGESLRKGRAESLHDTQAARADAKSLPFAANSFDLVVSLDVLEHIQVPRQAVDEMVRVIRPGGRLLCYAVSKRNKFTFNWLLEKMCDQLGIDPWSRVCHDPDLLVDPDMIYTHLSRTGCAVDRCESFHAFFTILFDQTLLVVQWLGSRIGLSDARGRIGQPLARWLLRITSCVCRFLAGPLQRLDSPWIKRGLSNGFIVIATKQQLGGLEK